MAQGAGSTKAAPAISTMASSNTRYPITTAQILDLAEYIVHQKRTVTMPMFVQLSWKRAMVTRDKHAGSYANEERIEKEANDGHIYSLWVLKRCHEILKDEVKTQKSKRLAPVQPASRLHIIPVTLEAEPKSAKPPTTTGTTGTSEVSQVTQIDIDGIATKEAEQEASHHDLDKMARLFEIDRKTKVSEELALRKACLADDMRKIMEQLERDWQDPYKDPTDEGYLDEVRATLMTEAALGLIRHQEMSLAEKSVGEGLGDFYPSPATDKFLGKTARSMARIENERKSQAGATYPFLMSRLTAKEIDTDEFLSEEEYKFLIT